MPRSIDRITRVQKLWIGLVTSMISVLASAAIAPSSASAACGGVSYPRVRYVCGTVSANFTYYTSLSTKHYNEMYEGAGAPLGIFLEDQYGSRFYYDYANSYVYRTFQSGYVRAFCWNRATSTITAECDYIAG